MVCIISCICWIHSILLGPSIIFKKKSQEDNQIQILMSVWRQLKESRTEDPHFYVFLPLLFLVMKGQNLLSLSLIWFGFVSDPAMFWG